jgi:hypothetical protein
MEINAKRVLLRVSSRLSLWMIPEVITTNTAAKRWKKA